MKFICLCTGGIVRSVTIAGILKYQYDQDAIAASFEKNTPETLKMLYEWADRIVIVDPKKLLDVPSFFRPKVRVIPIPVDKWGMSAHPELIQVIRSIDIERLLDLPKRKWTTESVKAEQSRVVPMKDQEIGDWDRHFVEVAHLWSLRSKDPSTQVGAVIADAKNRQVSQGYNGFARGVKDARARLENRETRLKMMLHAEVNAVLFAQRDLAGCTMYIWPFQSCAPCSALIIQSGITRVVTPQALPERWAADAKIAEEMFAEAGVSLVITG